MQPRNELQQKVPALGRSSRGFSNTALGFSAAPSLFPLLAHVFRTLYVKPSS